jgi:predicted GNAT family acetyltransferase
MKINEVYTADQIKSKGLIERDLTTISAKVFSNGQKVYFFEPINNQAFRLFSIISKRSFFL